MSEGPTYDEQGEPCGAVEFDHDDIDARLGWTEPNEKPQPTPQAEAESPRAGESELSALWFAVEDILAGGRHGAFARAVAWAAEIGMHGNQQAAADASGLSKGYVSKACGKLRGKLKEAANIQQKANRLKNRKLSRHR